ncbi:hypothetical protein BS78_K342000 [Paspalum vaginatum]|uniref:Uncharacterized protein n=1 Tax=Paspalum vaginatum TaxID=158149 RepID=A0A9W7XCW3_9POAL|nr:hypothetical protein BS78_K342000 [Paspalum vaginatum]
MKMMATLPPLLVVMVAAALTILAHHHYHAAAQECGSQVEGQTLCPNNLCCSKCGGSAASAPPPTAATAARAAPAAPTPTGAAGHSASLPCSPCLPASDLLFPHLSAFSPRAQGELAASCHGASPMASLSIRSNSLCSPPASPWRSPPPPVKGACGPCLPGRQAAPPTETPALLLLRASSLPGAALQRTRPGAMASPATTSLLLRLEGRQPLLCPSVSLHRAPPWLPATCPMASFWHPPWRLQLPGSQRRRLPSVRQKCLDRRLRHKLVAEAPPWTERAPTLGNAPLLLPAGHPSIFLVPGRFSRGSTLLHPERCILSAQHFVQRWLSLTCSMMCHGGAAPWRNSLLFTSCAFAACYLFNELPHRPRMMSIGTASSLHCANSIRHRTTPLLRPLTDVDNVGDA